MPHRDHSPGRRFKNLLTQSSRPLLLPGAYDAFSARLIERAGFPATYLGSYAAAASSYGLPDVGLLSVTEIVEEARRIVATTKIPVLADAENGFYDAPNLWRTIRGFESTGVAGIHIEDNLGGKHTATPLGLLPVAAMTQKVRAAIEARTDPDFLVIARSDAAWVTDDLDECVDRLRAYTDAGADLVFAPGMSAAQLATVRARLDAPVMVTGDLLDRPESDLPTSTLGDWATAGADVVLLFYTTIGAAAHNVATVLDALRRGEDLDAVNTRLTNQRHFERHLDYDEFEKRSAQFAVPSPPTT